jgi:hypothetical protein
LESETPAEPVGWAYCALGIGRSTPSQTRPSALLIVGNRISQLRNVFVESVKRIDQAYETLNQAYVAAKGFELADAWILQIGHIVSGHTLKHLMAAGGVACLLLMLRVRCRPGIPSSLRGF